MTWYGRGVTALFFLCLIVLVLHQIIAVDLWWQLATGRWVLQHGIPATDPFSYAFPDRPWIELRWLFCVASYAIFDKLGMNFLILGKALLLLLTFGLLFLAGRCRHAWPVHLGLVMTLAVAHERFMVRPELVSFVALAYTLLALQRYRCGAGARWIYALPLLQVLWTNAHTLWILGPAVQWIFVAGELIQRRLLPRDDGLSLARLRRLALVALGSSVAVLINPYFLEGASFPFLLLSEISGDHYLGESISEFLGPFSPFFFGWNYRTVAYLLVLSLSAIAFLLDWRRLSFSRLGWWLAFLFISLLAQRNVALFGFIAGHVTRLNLEDRSAAAQSGQSSPPWITAMRLIPAAFLVLMIPLAASDLFYRAIGSSRRFGFGVSDQHFPIRALAFARSRGLPLPVLNELGDGGYVLFEGGRRSVYVDGRLEVYGVEQLRRALELTAGNGDVTAEADAVGARLALVRHHRSRRLLQQLEQSPDWVPVYYDHLHLLYLRRLPETSEAVRRFGIDWRRPPEFDLARPERLAPADWLEGLVPRVGDPHRFERLGSLFAAVGNYERAQALFEQAVKTAPHDPRACLYLGLLYEAAGRETEARRLLRHAPRGYRRQADVNGLAGEMHLRMGNASRALDYFDQARALGAPEPLASERIARAAIAAGRLDRADGVLADLLRNHPQRPRVHNLLAALDVRRDRLEQAAAHFERSLRLQPDQPAVEETLASIYDRLGLADRAAELRSRRSR